jgi:hypothetical protein
MVQAYDAEALSPCQTALTDPLMVALDLLQRAAPALRLRLIRKSEGFGGALR